MLVTDDKRSITRKKGPFKHKPLHIHEKWESSLKDSTGDCPVLHPLSTYEKVLEGMDRIRDHSAALEESRMRAFSRAQNLWDLYRTVGPLAQVCRTVESPGLGV